MGSGLAAWGVGEALRDQCRPLINHSRPLDRGYNPNIKALKRRRLIN